MNINNPPWLTDELLTALYQAETTWRTSHVRAPDEIAVNPNDVEAGATQLLGYGVIRDPEVQPGTFEFRRVTRTVSHVETWTFAQSPQPGGPPPTPKANT